MNNIIFTNDKTAQVVRVAIEFVTCCILYMYIIVIPTGNESRNLFENLNQNPTKVFSCIMLLYYPVLSIQTGIMKYHKNDYFNP